MSQAMAAVGSMPGPSITLSGFVHFHDQLGGNVHSHGGDNSEGHVHAAPDHDDDGGPSLTWHVFSNSITSPQAPDLTTSFELIGRVDLPIVRTIDGVRPDTLLRPPSTLSIA